MSRRAQASLEFLTTYGWAFLVILIMMSALAYFGVLNPSKLLPDRCNFGAEIGCNKNTMIVRNVAVDTLTMRLANNFGVGVVVTSARVTTDITVIDGADNIPGNDYDCTEKMDNVVITAVTWNSDSTITFNANCDEGASLVDNEKIKFNIEINYYPASAGPTYSKTVFGEVYTTIQ